jgi:O-antigen chain-terminating methyltransferase
MTDEELTAAIEEAQERARARAPQGQLSIEGVYAADLMPLVHARDAAQAKVAAIGTVNPRPPGLKNSVVQSVKRWVARALDWHVREQVEFNRASLECVYASIEALNTVNRSFAALASHATESEERAIRNEVHILRTISELQAAYQHRLTVQEDTFKGMVKSQHHDYLGALDRSILDIQKRLWNDLVKVRQEFERLIHQELRVLRQKPNVTLTRSTPSSVGTTEQEAIPIDWLAFAARFRGSEERIRSQQDRYIKRFTEAGGSVLDIGCGRGEFLEAAREAGLTAHGIDSSQESVDVCRAKGLEVESADLFTYLESQPDASLANVYCAQVVEHLSPANVARFVNLLGHKMHSGAIVAVETPNPECLAIFATYFYIDPTHTRPVPAQLLRYYLHEAGFVGAEPEYLEPAANAIPALAELPAGVREALFGGLDYAMFARKL